MFYQDFSNWSALGKNVFEPIFDLQKITMPFFEKITRESISCISDNTASAIKYMQGLNKVSKLGDFINTQIVCLAEHGEKNLQHGQQFLKIGEEGLREWRENAIDKMEKMFAGVEEMSTKGRKSSSSSGSGSHTEH